MDLPKDYLDKMKSKKPFHITSERQELIQRFVDRINLERIGTKFKPVIWRQINGLVALIKISDLYWLYKTCEQRDSFSKAFFGILKSTKVKK